MATPSKKAPLLLLIESSIPGTKKDSSGKEVPYTSDGKGHSSQRLYPFLDASSITDAASLKAEFSAWVDSLDSLMASVKDGKIASPTGPVRIQVRQGVVTESTLDKPISFPAPFTAGTKLVDEIVGILNRGFSLLHQGPMNKALTDKWVPPSTKTGKAKTSSKAFDPTLVG